MSNSVSTYFHKLSGNAIIRRSLIALVIIVILYTVLGFLVLPAVIKSQTEKLIEKNFHRQATIGKVEVNPYTLQTTIHGLKVAEPAGNTAFLAFDTLTINLSSESLWRFVPVVQEVKLVKPYVHLVREDAHHYNIDDILDWVASRPPSKEPARFALHNIQLEDGRIAFEDRPAKATHEVTALQLGIPFISSLPSQVKIFVEPLLSAKVNGTPVLLKGKALPFADPREAVVELNLDALDLTRYLEYLPLQLAAKVPSGKLEAHLTASFRQPKDTAPALNLNGTASLKALRVTEANGQPVLTLPELTMTLKDANLFGKRLNVALIEADGLEANLSRDRDHQWNVQKLVSAKKAAAHPVKSKPAPSSAAALQIALDEFRIRGAAIRYNDDYAAQPMHGNVDKFDLSARNVAIDTAKKAVTVGELVSEQGSFLLHHARSTKEASAHDAAVKSDTTSDDTAFTETVETTEAPATSRKAEAGYAVHVNRIRVDNWAARVEDEAHAKTAVTTIAPISLTVQNLSTNSSSPAQASLKATVNKAGHLALNGNVGLSPLQADLNLDLSNVDILPLQPYFTEQVNIKLTQAALSGKGHVRLAEAQGGSLGATFNGNMALNNVASVDKITGDDFLRWKSLAFDGVRFQSTPLALNIDQVALNDFYARVIVDPHGRINVQNITRKAAGNKSVTRGEQRPANTQASATANSSHRAGATKPKLPNVNIKRLVLQGGRVRYTDNFIKPNYSADLMNLGGTVTGLSSEASSTASVSLHGEVNRAPLAIAGRVNPLAKDLFLDVKARVQGMDLPSLSPYSAKYIGYEIEKGKLSFEVSYLVQNRNVTAQNRLILDQLTIGNKVDSPSALNLPVRLAISLLKDRNGVIDVDVPIGGSLDDPEFSIGGIVMKIIGHAITRAVTQPFAMLGSLFGHGGNEELSMLEFDPGRAMLRPAAEDKLKSLAKALNERPELELEITGRADPNTDVVGLKRASVDRKVRALKYKELTDRGETVDQSTVVVNPDEYPKLLTQAYLDEKFAKPRNVLGLPKNIPVGEMEKLMISNAPVNNNDLITLANRRALAVKDWLVKMGKVPDNRIFILASKVGGEEATAGGKNAPLTRVDFSLK